MIAVAANSADMDRGSAEAEGVRPTVGTEDFESRFLTVALAIYFVIYATEGFTRWVLNLVGLDAFIFVRDALIFGAMGFVVASRLIKGRFDRVVVVFGLLLVCHGIIGYANLKGVAPIIAGAKPYLSLLIGVFVASRLMKPGKLLITLFAVLWIAGFVSAGVEKYFVDWPWIGMKAEIAGQQVEVSRDWQVGTADKRAGGLARSSIHLASLMSALGIILFFAARSWGAQAMIALCTILTVYWSTQKGALIAIIAVFLAGAVPPRFRIGALKAVLLVLLVLMVALPLILPQYVMPDGSEGVFSLQSFYDRAQRMWPDAWDWYNQRSTPLFGVGLGGIGFAMRLYSPEAAFYAADLASYEPYLINFADNMFVYLYVQLGALSLLYIGVAVVGALRVSGSYDRARAAAVASLVFCFGYGIAVSIIEDQIACMILGASVFFLWCHGGADAPREGAPATPLPRAADLYCVPFTPRRRGAALALREAAS